MCPTQKHKYTNTAYGEVPERPSIWYISASSAHHQHIISASLLCVHRWVEPSLLLSGYGSFLHTVPSYFPMYALCNASSIIPNCHFHLGQLQVIDDEGWFWPHVDGGNGMLGNLLMMMLMVTMKVMICWLGNDYDDNADDGDMMTSGLSIQSVIPFFIAKNGRLPICISNDGDKMTVKKAWLMLMMV